MTSSGGVAVVQTLRNVASAKDLCCGYKRSPVSRHADVGRFTETLRNVWKNRASDSAQGRIQGVVKGTCNPMEGVSMATWENIFAPDRATIYFCWGGGGDPPSWRNSGTVAADGLLTFAILVHRSERAELVFISKTRCDQENGIELVRELSNEAEF